jgi:hypothetical protein
MTAVGLPNAQLGEMKVKEIAGENIYHGVPPEQLLPMIADALGDEQQYRRMEAAANERRHEAVDARLDRIVLVLGRLTTTLIVQAIVLGLLLLISIEVIVVLLSPHLVAWGGA